MVLQCLHYNYNNSSETCTDSYEKCARQVDCSSEVGHHCFVVWQVESNVTTTISAGCNPPYQATPDEKCSNECIGQPKGSKYYCCCTGNLCNMKFTLPVPKLEGLAKPKEVDPEIHNTSGILWSVIPIVLMIMLVGTYMYWYKRGTSKNRDDHHSGNNSSDNNNRNGRNKVVSGNLNDRELNELRNNNDISILIPFRNTFGAHIFNNNHHHLDNNNNNGRNNHRTLTNHHDANNINITTKQQKDNRIDLNSIKLLEIIGSGRFGTVHRASLENSNDNEVAVKIISSIEHQSWLNEQEIYNSPRVKHPNVLSFLYSDEHLETETYWLVVEYASKGSLYSFLKENIITWKEFLYISLGIVRGLSHLHEADIAHRDFKSKNVLLKHDLTPCITDFGVAAVLDTTTGSQLDHRKKYLQVGTPRYMAPEVLECSVTFTKASFTKIDVYALSLVLWELISRCRRLPGSARLDTNFSTHPVHHLSSDSGGGGGGGDDLEREETLELRDLTDEFDNEEPKHDDPPPYKLPFEDLAGPNPDINKMRQIVVVDKFRPVLRDEWRVYPASEFCRAIEDGWEYDHDARISASCFVERVESLPQSI